MFSDKLISYDSITNPCKICKEMCSLMHCNFFDCVLPLCSSYSASWHKKLTCGKYIIMNMPIYITCMLLQVEYGQPVHPGRFS